MTCERDNKPKKNCIELMRGKVTLFVLPISFGTRTQKNHVFQRGNSVEKWKIRRYPDWTDKLKGTDLTTRMRLIFQRNWNATCYCEGNMGSSDTAGRCYFISLCWGTEKLTKSVLEPKIENKLLFGIWSFNTLRKVIKWILHVILEVILYVSSVLSRELLSLLKKLFSDKM